MKILIVDNTRDADSWGSAELRRYASMNYGASGATVITRRAPEGDLPKNPSEFDRIIVSGSRTRALDDAPWVDALLQFIRSAVDQNKPYLGVCYGHQMLVRAMGGKNLVRVANQSEHGWTKITLVENCELTQGLKNEFYSFSSHYDEVGSLPTGFKRLARSADCSIQACRLEDKPIFGIQFHPEKNLEEAKRGLERWSKAPRINAPKRLLHPHESEKLYDASVADKIFGNFLKL